MPTSDLTSLLPSLAAILEKKAAELGTRQVMAGFDAFIDSIIRVIHTKDAAQPEYFSSIGDFGKYIVDKSTSSFSLETEQRLIKLGGNMPILANALGQMGSHVHCIGAFGHPVINPVFDSLSKQCHLYSFANPGTSTAIEFNDGKVMLADMGTLNADGWDVIRSKVGQSVLSTIFNETDLLCLLNWSEIDQSTNIWQGVLRDFYKRTQDSYPAFVFADLSDCSKRSAMAISEAISILQQFQQYSKLVLGLNRNETNLVYRSLFEAEPGMNMIANGQRIFDRLHPHWLVVHHTTTSALFSDTGVTTLGSLHTENPVISTGAGDNFNAGCCAGLLLDLEPVQALLLANTVAGFYVRNGFSGTTSDLIDFLKTFKT